MNRILLGKIVGTHGIKGEVRIRSDFPYKEKAFRVGTHLWIGKKEEQITRYRVHKNFDMVTFLGKDNINDVLFYQGKEVYKEKEELALSAEDYLDEDLFDYQLKTNYGDATLLEIFWASPTNKQLRILLAEKEILVPFREPFVKVKPKEQEIEVTLLEGMV